jgi:hypothetical protein
MSSDRKRKPEESSEKQRNRQEHSVRSRQWETVGSDEDEDEDGRDVIASGDKHDGNILIST